ncbi:MAG: hypothetical protein ACOY17_02330 [Pseudomonadota bacterium]
MGTFTITRAEYRAEQQNALRQKHLRNGFTLADSRRFKDWNLSFYTRIGRQNSAFYDRGEAGFIGVAGSMIFDGLTGEEAAAALFDSFDGITVDWRRTHGGFTVIMQKFGRLFVFGDRLGLNKIYLDTAGNCVSNSFLSVLEQIGRCTPDPVGAHIYAWLSLIYGDRTFISEIRPASPNSLIEPGKTLNIRQLSLPIDRSLADWPLDEAQSAEFFLERLRKLFAIFARSFKGRVNCSLSGGYDSRFVMCLLLDAGIKPSLYVYGAPSDPDVIIAKELAAIAGQEIEWVHKEAASLPAMQEWPDQLDAVSFALDGWTNGGIITQGISDLATRLSRSQDDQVLMLGTAGEIFRNFFYLPDRAISLERFIRAMYCRFDPAAFGPDFSVGDYRAALRDDVQSVTGVTSDRMDRRQIEMIYPLLRARYMFGRDMVINQRFGWSFSPFLEPAIFEGAHNLPLKFKTLGNLESRMIRMLNPQLAACPSAYGHSFTEPTPIASKLRYYVQDHYRPLWLREKSYRFQHRKPENLPAILQGGYLKSIIDPEYPFMRRLFNLARVYDAGAMNRITTMEYLLQKANG